MIGSRARPSAYQIRKILFAPGARGVCHDPEKPFFGNLPRVSFRSPSPRFLQTPRNRPRHNTPPPLSVKGSQSRSGKRPHHPHVRPVLACRHSNAAPLRFVKHVNSKIRLIPQASPLQTPPFGKRPAALEREHSSLQPLTCFYPRSLPAFFRGHPCSRIRAMWHIPAEDPGNVDRIWHTTAYERA